MFASLHALEETCNQSFTKTSDTVTILNKTTLQSHCIDELIDTAMFASDDTLKKTARQHIFDVSNYFGKSSSIAPLYQAFGDETVTGFTVPAMNIRTLTYDTARIIFRMAKQKNALAFIFEIARSEMNYTAQRPEEYAVAVLAAAIKEDFHGPVFLQGDHFQLNKKSFDENEEQEIKAIQSLITESINASFLNIDIDASTLVDLTASSLIKQQETNSRVTADLTNFIRKQHSSSLISVGGEIGHIGGKNSTPEEFEAFMTLYTQKVTMDIISKVSVQTGTTHGGIPLPDGSVAPVKLDFNVLKDIGSLAREKYGMGGAVQHGASTLPIDLFDNFVKAQTLEIHLATGFQNIVYDALPRELKMTMYAWIDKTLGKEREETSSDDQFYYTSRKKALGPFKQELWHMRTEEKQPVLQNLEHQLSLLFDKLNIAETKEIVTKYV